MREIFSNTIDYKSGQGGSLYITASASGAFQGFVACEDTVISDIKDQNGQSILSALGLSGQTLKQGLYFGVPKGMYISQITLTSGSVIGYYTLTGGIVIPGSFTGLLDTYTGAAAAYSLRLLRSAYTGYAIKVRRASDNTEQDIGFSNNELDTTSLASFCSGTNGFVTTWYDQSGNGNDATQTTAANQPQIVSSGSVITENGKPAVQFDGSDDTMVATYTLGTDLTSVLVLKSNVNTATADNVIYQYNIDNNNHFAHGFRNGGLFTRLVKNGTVNDENGYDFSSTSNFLSFNIYDYANSTNTLYVDNIIGTDVNAGRSQYQLGSFIQIMARAGGTFNVDGKLSEIIFYPSDQSTNRTGIETNINDFYTIY